MARGKLRLYLGAAPGVGKTYAMLNEGWRRKERGTDVVVGWVAGARPAPDRRPDPRPGGLPAADRRVPGPDLRGDGRRRSVGPPAQLVLVDELAHTNVPGSEHAKRWQDVEELLDAGINVISTVNLQHLESLNDVVEQITGVTQQRDGARSGGAGRRPDRAGRHGPRGAAPAAGPRQRLPTGAHRRRAGQLLPYRQPHRAARAGPAVGGRSGGRGAQRLPRTPQHRRTVGDQGAGGGVPHRLAGQCRAHPAGGPDGHAHQGRAGRRARPHRRRPDRRRGSRDWSTTAPCSTTSGAASSRWSAPTWHPPWCRWPGPRTPPSW